MKRKITMLVASTNAIDAFYDPFAFADRFRQQRFSQALIDRYLRRTDD
jgi:hypothetical protein